MKLLRRALLLGGLAGAVGLAVLLSTFPGNQAFAYVRYLLSARPAADVAEDPSTPPGVKRRLEVLQEARRRAAALGLKVGDAYSTVADDGGGPVVHVVTAAWPDRLEPVTWWYPVVGTVPYRGYFDRRQAEALQEALRHDGLDTWVRGAPAFSSLGLFPEPLPLSTLDWPDSSLVGLVLHECVHRTVYFSGQTDFNEGLATFVERTAVLEGAEHPEELSDAWNRQERVHARLRKAADELRRLYDSRPPAVLEARKPLYDRLAADLEQITGRPDARPWNNARLLGNLSYVGDLSRFEEVHRRLGGSLAGTVRFFASLDPRREPWSQVQERLTRGTSPAGSAP